MTRLATAPRIIVVLGPYRSGTSLTARVLNRLGVHFGPTEALVPPNRHNPGGYLERTDLNTANSRLIVSAGGSLHHPPRPAEIVGNGELDVLKTVDLSWTPGCARWGLKDPRLCHTLLAWIQAGLLPIHDLGIVHVLRDDDAVIRSARRHESVIEYAEHDEHHLRHMIRRCREDAEWHATHLGVPNIPITYDDLIREPRQTTRKLAAFVSQPSSWRVLWASCAIGKRRHEVWGQLRAQYLAQRNRLTMTLGRMRRGTRGSGE